MSGFESRVFDVVYLPSFLESLSDLLHRDSSGTSPINRLLLAEAQHKVGAPRLDDRIQASGESLSLLVGEGVKQPTVCDSFESFPEPVEAESVCYQKRDLRTSQGRLPLCLFNREGGCIHRPNL